MVKIGYRVVNVGERDLQLGYDDFMAKTAGLSLEFVSSNIVKQGTTDLVFKPYTIVELKGDGGPAVKVGVTGAVRFNPVWQKAGPDGTNLGIVSPLEMAKRYVPELRKQADIVVFLAALSKGDAQRLAREVPGIDVIAGAFGGIYSTAEESVGSTRIYYSGNQGKRVGETRVFLDANRRVASMTSYMHFLTTRYPDDPAMLLFVGDVFAKIGKMKGVAAPAPATSGGH